MGNTSAFGSLARKAIASLIIVVAVAIFLFSAVSALIAGFVKLLLTIGLVIVVAVRVVWAAPQAVIYLLRRALVRSSRPDWSGAFAARRSSSGFWSAPWCR